MNKFKIGDRVRVVRTNEEDLESKIEIGNAGTILEEVENLLYVRMDKYNKELHNINGLCEDGYGWGFYKCQLEHAEEKEEPKQKMTIKELQQIIIDNFYDGNIIDLSNMDFKGYTVDFSNIMAKHVVAEHISADEIFMGDCRAKRIEQDGHIADEIIQDCHEAKNLVEKQRSSKDLFLELGYRDSVECCKKEYQDGCHTLSFYKGTVDIDGVFLNKKDVEAMYLHFKENGFYD